MPDIIDSPAVLTRLAMAARRDREQFFAQHPRWRRAYGDRVEAVVLAERGRRQVEGARVAPLEVWTFFRHHPDGPFPTRRRRVPANQAPWDRILDHDSLAGRPVTLACVSLEADRFDAPGDVLKRYLLTGRSAGSTSLAKARVTILDPSALRGTLIWEPPVGLQSPIARPQDRLIDT